MADVYKSHPTRNLEDTIHEVMHHTISPEKLPTGAVIQTRYIRRKADRLVNTSGWVEIDRIDFTPLLATSVLRLSINYSVGAQASNDFRFRFIDAGAPGTSVTELARTGIHRTGSENLDAYPTRFAWVHYHHVRTNETRPYRLQAIRESGSGIIWAHTYGVQTTSFFTIEEIKQ